MSNSKLYQPPPPPPKRAAAPVDPLLALSKAPTMIATAAAAEELTDLTDDEGLEEWAKGGTRIMPKPEQAPQSQAQPRQPTMMASPLPSFHPVAYSMPPRIHEKKMSAAIWVVPLALFVFAGGVVAAAAGWYVYHTSDTAANAATVDTSSNVVVTSAPTETAPPAVTLTATTAPTVTATATATPTTTATMTVTSTSTKRSASTNTTSTSTTGTGSLRTFAAGNGKPVYVDGKQVGYGGGKLTTVCGRHSVSVGTGHARSVEIPCNGATVTVGTPDGS